MKLFLFVLLSCTLSTVRAELPDEVLHDRIARLQKALQTHDSELLKPLLSDSCRIEQFDGAVGRKVLQALISQLPTDSLHVTAIRHTDEYSEVEAERFFDGKSSSCSFRFDRAGYFRRISLNTTVQVHKADTTPRRIMPYSELPFEIRNGFIILREGIAMEGRSGIFVLDTGCKSILFNAASPVVAASLDSAQGVAERTGVVSSGIRTTQLVTTDSFALGNNLFALKGIASNLSALAESLELEELTGLIGAELLQRFEIHIDYASKMLRLYALDTDGFARDVPQPKQRFAFDLFLNYLPLFDVRVASTPLRMVFDTGAQRCCITPDCARRLGRKYKKYKAAKLQDADASTTVESGNIARLHWNGIERRHEPVVVRDLSALGDIDGILGYPLVEEQHISLNYMRREFCFY